MSERGRKFMSYAWIGIGLAIAAIVVLATWDANSGRSIEARLDGGASLIEQLFSSTTDAISSTCVTEEQALARARITAPNEFHEKVNPRAFMTALNSLPPVSDIPTPEVLIIYQAPGLHPMMQGYDNGCQVFSLTVPIEVYDEVVDLMRRMAPA